MGIKWLTDLRWQDRDNRGETHNAMQPQEAIQFLKLFYCF